MPSRHIEYLRVDEIVPATLNPKRHHDQGIGESMARWGYTEPVVMDERTGRLIAGHGRVESLTARHAQGAAPPEGIEVALDGGWLLPVVRGWSSRDDAEAAAALVASNKLVEAGGWDEDMLADLLGDYAGNPDWLTGTGYDETEVVSFLARLHPDEPVVLGDPDDVPDVPVEPVSQRGDVFILDRHRVLCGDCRSPDDLARLMAGGLAACLWTDPPYGVDYVGKTKRALTIENDGKEGLRAFVGEALRSMTHFLVPGSAFYLACPAGTQGTEMRLAVADTGWALHEELVWVKDQFVLGHSDYHYRHEPILYGWVPGPGRSGRGNHDGSRWMGDHAQDSVFEIPRPKRSESHPTMKPVALVVAHLLNSTAPGEVVLDGFGGSGSTLIAAHQTGRTARLCDVDRSYVDVILRRFQSVTGIVPVLESTGEPHDFLADEAPVP